MAGRHRHHSTGVCTQWLRAGALTVGLGAAVTAGQAVASAAPADATDSGQTTSTAGPAANDNSGDTESAAAASAPEPGSSSTSSTSDSTTHPTSTLSAQQNTGDSTPADAGTEKKSERSADSAIENPTPPMHSESTSALKTATEAIGTVTSNNSGSASLDASPDSGTRAQTRSQADVAAQTVSVRSALTTTASVTTPTVVSVAVPGTSAAVPAVRTVAAQSPVTVSTMVADVLTWMGWGQLANGLRIPGAPVPDLVAALWLVVRQAAYSVNNQRPIANTTVSGPGPDGVFTGNVNATDYDDATLTYTVSRGPEHGTLVVDTAGGFTYTPDPEWSAVGGTDGFTITVDDTAGNPPHIHGLLDLIGQLAPTATTVTVTVSPIGSNAAALGRTHYFIDGALIGRTVTTKADAAELLNTLAPTLGATAGFADPDNITIQRVGTDIPGDVAETFYRLHESIDGITVLGSNIILVTDSAGTVTGLFNNHDGRIASTDTAPDAGFDSPSEAVAVAAAAYLASTTGQSDRAALAALMAASTFEPDLVVYALDSSAAPRLAWRVVVKPTVGLTDDAGNTYFIYANGAEAGTVIVDTPNVQALATTTTARDVLGQARQINVEDTTVWFFFHISALSDTSRNLATYWTAYQFFGWGAPVLPGNLVNQGWFGWDASAVSAHANMASTYDYYANVLGLNSFNGDGARIDVNIEYNPHATFMDYFTGYSNAFWDPSKQQFAFGNGGDLEAALDVVAHEYTHAVVSHAVGDGGSILDYGESGALNEALADIMGILIEGKTGAGRWLIGEDSHFAGGAIRNIANPSAITTAYGPYRQTYATRYTGTGDDGGEHINSTIFSHAAYEMMTDPATAAISTQTWAKVFYHALYRLSAGAKFSDGRAAVLDSADALGFTGAQLDAIERAFDDAGILSGVTVLV